MPNISIWGPLFGSMCPTFAALFLRPRARNLLTVWLKVWFAWYFGWIRIPFWWYLGPMLIDSWPNANRPKIVFTTLLKKASHGQTSTRIHKLGRRGREALWIISTTPCWNYSFATCARDVNTKLGYKSLPKLRICYSRKWAQHQSSL